MSVIHAKKIIVIIVVVIPDLAQALMELWKPMPARSKFTEPTKLPSTFMQAWRESPAIWWVILSPISVTKRNKGLLKV